MMSYSGIRTAQLVRKLVPHSISWRTWSLAGGTSAEMTILEIDEGNKISHFVVRQPSEATLKRNPYAAEHEFMLLELAQALGLAAPRPIYFDQDGTFSSNPCLVMEYIEGRPMFAPKDAKGFINQLAKHLVQIHSADLTNKDVSFLSRRTADSKELGQEWPLTDAPSLSTELFREQILSNRPTQRNASALLHGDYWPGNVLWRGDELVAVVDWESANMGDPLSDMAITRLEIYIMFGMEAMLSFTHHYRALLSIDYTELPKWDLCAALRLAREVGCDLGKWCDFHREVGRGDITERKFRDRFNLFAEQALEQFAKSR